MHGSLSIPAHPIRRTKVQALACPDRSSANRTPWMHDLPIAHHASRSLARPFRAHRSRDAGRSYRRPALLGFLPLQRSRNRGFVLTPRPRGRDVAEVASPRHVPPSAFRTLPAVCTPHVPCEPVEGSLTLLGFRLQGFHPTREPYPSRGLPALLPFTLPRAPRSARGVARLQSLAHPGRPRRTQTENRVRPMPS